jgi:hypothetical protein
MTVLTQRQEDVSAITAIHDPRGTKEITHVHAPRLQTLDGKRVALVSNDMWQADPMLRVLHEALSAKLPNTVFLTHDKFPRGNSHIDSPTLVKALAAEKIDAAILGNAACGACATAVGNAAARLEEAGIPTVVVARDNFADVAKNAFSSRGFAGDACLVTFPIGQFLPSGDPANAAAAMPAAADGLIHWKAPAIQSSSNEAPRIELALSSDPLEAIRQLNGALLNNRCGDGLPLYPPTERLVDWILTGTDLPRDHLIGRIQPRNGLATVETIAVSLAMAGGRPEYLPVLIAAVDAMIDPAMEHGKAQANSGSPFPVVIVNGPAAAQIRLNSGFGLLGPDPRQPAGAAIGRALRLLLQNVGGVLPGQGTMAAYGSMRFTNAVFAEAESELPDGWKPLSSDFGIAPGTNSVTVFAAVGGVSAPRRGTSADDLEREIVNGLHRVAAYLRTPNRDYVVGWANGTPGAVLISPTVARQLVSLGWSKEKFRDTLWEYAKVSKDVVENAGLVEWIRASGDEVTRLGPIDPWPICRTPEQLLIAVAGGDHPSNHFWFPADAPAVSVRTFDLPKGWNDLLLEAEAELGAGGSACLL